MSLLMHAIINKKLDRLIELAVLVAGLLFFNLILMALSMIFSI